MAKTTKFFIEDFIEATNKATTADEVFGLYKQAIYSLGYDKAVYTFVTDHTSIGLQAGHGLLCNYPEEWMQHYTKKEYGKIDPVTEYAFSTREPFTWDQLSKMDRFTREQLSILNEAIEIGLNEGLGIPLYGPRGEIAGLGLASSCKDINPDRNTLSKLKLITEQFHSSYCSLFGKPREDKTPRLTKREVEVVKWLAAGKTADEIGIILSCSRSNVKWHVVSACDKLEVHNKTLLVTKAIKLGIIPLDCVKV